MVKIGEEKLPFTRIDHIGVTVKDIDKAVAHYQSLGMGPFEPLYTTLYDRQLHGKSVDDVRVVIRVAKIGQVEFELVQPVSGESVHREFLEKHGEGISHLGFFVDDLDKEVAKLVAKGFKVVTRGKFVGGGGLAYLDTDKAGGVFFELIQFPPS
ncbi:VOC family protein [Chloroflexota bacterium]